MLLFHPIYGNASLCNYFPKNWSDVLEFQIMEFIVFFKFSYTLYLAL